MKIGQTVVFLSLFVFVACNSSKKTEKHYYQIQLSTIADYQRKMDMMVHFLSEYDDEAQNLCHTVISDLTVFEEDIKSELNENDDLTIQQVDSMRVMLHQATALRRFIDCIAFCSDNPTIGEKELTTAIQLLQFNRKTVFTTYCTETIEVSKEKYLFYFLINTTTAFKNIRYSYFTLLNEAKTGMKNVPARGAVPIYGIFNEYYNDWITIKSATCN